MTCTVKIKFVCEDKKTVSLYARTKERWVIFYLAPCRYIVLEIQQAVL